MATINLPYRGRAARLFSSLLIVVFSFLLEGTSRSQDYRDRDASGAVGDPFGDALADPQARFAPPGQRPPPNFRLGIYSRSTPTGVVVTNVQPGSPAQQAGIEVNDTIITVGGYQVGVVNGRNYDIAEELTRRVDGQGRATLLVQNSRNGQLLNIPVQFNGGFPGYGLAVTGSVNTGNRNLVVQGMILNVRLVDISYPQWQNVAVAETQIPYTGRWPINYQLDIDSTRIRPDHRYGVDAVITQFGNPVLATNSPVPVNVASGNPIANLTLIPSRDQSTGQNLPASGQPIQQISGWYQQLLGRNLNDREQAVWQRELAKGKPLDEILATILCSSEYFDQYRGNVDLYIDGIYQFLFGRNATPQEIQRLRNQMSQSAELRRLAIQSLIRQRNR